MGGSLPSSNQILDRDNAPVPASPELADYSDLLSALLENSTDRIYFKDLESRFIRINRYKAQLMHLADPSEAIGKTDQDFLAGDRGTGRRLDELEIIQTGAPLIDKEEREEWPDGRVTWASTSKMPLFNSAGKCVGTFGISRDITSRKLAERALDNARRDAELFIDSVPSILIGLDAENRIERWNLAAAKTFGISKAEACGKLLACCGVKWLSDIDSEIRPLSAATEPVRWDVSFKKNGEERSLGLTLRWIRPFASDKPELLIVGTDVTERKRADEELQWKTALLEAQTNAAQEQHRLINAEKQLLEQTLRGSVHVLSEVLSFSNPAAFGRAMRLRSFVQQVAKSMNLESAWQFEIAAMLSQLGCVTLPAELMNAAYAGDRLSPEDQKKYDAHPAVAWQMLSSIPRMKAIAQMIANQNIAHPHIEARNDEERREIELGVQLLQTGLAFERCQGRALSPAETAKQVRATCKGFDAALLNSLDDLVPPMPMLVRECAITDLAVGMTLQQDICNSIGLLIVAKGQELTYQWIERLKGLSKLGVIGRRVSVMLPENNVG
jgi:PAS domain S-box-containing protein